MALRRIRSIPSGLARGPRRQTNWLASADVTVITGLAGNAAVIDQAFSAAQIGVIGPLTITRTRGTLWVSSDQATADETPFGALGMMVVREQANAAGVASVPTPITEEFDDGFFVHQFWLAGLRFTQQDATGVQIDDQRFTRYDFDSKAQRKVTSDDAIVVTLENASASHGVVYVLKFRMLVKLH